MIYLPGCQKHHGWSRALHRGHGAQQKTIEGWRGEEQPSLEVQRTQIAMHEVYSFNITMKHKAKTSGDTDPTSTEERRREGQWLLQNGTMRA